MFVLDDTFLFSFQVGIYYVEIFVQNKVYFFSNLVCFLHVVELESCVGKIGIMLWTVARVAGMVEDDDKGDFGFVHVLVTSQSTHMNICCPLYLGDLVLLLGADKMKLMLFDFVKDIAWHCVQALARPADADLSRFHNLCTTGLYSLRNTRPA